MTQRAFPKSDPTRRAAPPHARGVRTGSSERGRDSTLVARAPDPEPASRDGAGARLTRIVGDNLRRLRTTRGLSLEKLSRASGVSRAMLSQVELGRSTPTINVLWKVARALAVPFSALITDHSEKQPTVLRAATSKVLASHDGSFLSRALFPFDAPRSVEFYELRLAPHALESAEPHPPGTHENLVVTEGRLVIVIGPARHELGPGDAILFEADVPHEYRNETGEPIRMFLVMTYETAERAEGERRAIRPPDEARA